LQGSKVVQNPVRKQINTKFANCAGVYVTHFTTFRGQTFYSMVFLPVVMDFILLAEIKI
jgi:hypothetical protein